MSEPHVHDGTYHDEAAKTNAYNQAYSNYTEALSIKDKLESDLLVATADMNVAQQKYNDDLEVYGVATRELQTLIGKLILIEKNPAATP